MQKETFINYLQYEKRFSTHTIIAYEHDLEQFATFLQDTYSLTSMLEVRHSHPIFIKTRGHCAKSNAESESSQNWQAFADVLANR